MSHRTVVTYMLTTARFWSLQAGTLVLAGLSPVFALTSFRLLPPVPTPPRPVSYTHLTLPTIYSV